MASYDIVFMGHLATATVVPFEGPSFVEKGGPAFFGPLAASCLGKRIAAITTVADGERELLDPLQKAGVDLYLQDRATAQIRVIHPKPSVDERRIFLVQRGGYFSIDDVPPMDPCLFHLGGLSDREFSLELMRDLKARGFSLSVDMQSLLWHVDDRTQAIRLGDIREKEEIFRLMDFVKLDVMEAKALTGTDVIKDQARLLEGLGASEIVITSADGALARNGGRNMFTKFTNKNTRGRTGRGDTFTGAYLASRLDHSVEDSLRFATALTSIKMESTGPFTGSLEDVIGRMNDPFER